MGEFKTALNFVLEPKMKYSKTVHITEDLVKQFALLTSDLNPIHLDPTYAATTKFGHCIAHGMLIGSFISPALVEEFGSGTIYVTQVLHFIYPVYVGNHIRIELDYPPKINYGRRSQEIDIKIYSYHQSDLQESLAVNGIATIISGN